MNPPLGLCYIGAYLKFHGYDVEGLDFSLHKEDYENSEDYLNLIPMDGHYYGIYCPTAHFQWLVPIVRHIRQNNFNAKVAVGGPHATNLPNDCLDIGAHYAVRGDGERSMLSLVQKRKISKEIYRENYLDNLPFPDRDIFGLHNYKRMLNGERAVHIVTLRGCPYNCHYCDKTSVGTKVRYRSVPNVLAEMEHINEQYGINSFVIYDDIFTLDHERVHLFCDEFKRRGISWRCWSRTDTLTESLLIKMKYSGLTSITLGVESGDDRILKSVGKGTTAKNNELALQWCKGLDIPTRCSLMYGNPGETKKTLDNTISLIEKTQPDEWNLALLTPIPGSAFWNHPHKFGLSFDKDWLKRNWYAPCNRLGISGIGSSWIEITSMTNEDFRNNLKYFVERLSEVCPRKKIQDTIQEINIEGIN
jgi:radical SAM superfamily enzyme YgiQ (UPF0313 family)